MTTQFELSAYGVEEMDKKEMIEVDGGVAPLVWLIIGAVGSLGSVVGAVYATLGYYDSEKNQTISTHKFAQITIHDADSVKVFPDGSMYIYGGDACFRDCNH